jgi:iron complex outermembrane recepter protein
VRRGERNSQHNDSRAYEVAHRLRGIDMRARGIHCAVGLSALMAAGTFGPRLGFGAEAGSAPAGPADAADVQGQQGAPGADGAGVSKLSEIVVTAEKRTERLQDVPIPVSAITTEGLLENNQTNLVDYFAKVPGVNFTSNVRGAPVIAIRGLATGTDLVNPTVGIVIDDVPFGSSTGLGGGDTTPDIDPSDLERVEVLRGPQGTLYGASSLGGLIKYVTRSPSTAGTSGELQVGMSAVRNGEQPGYNVRGSVNLPVTDDLAVLVSGFTHQDSGYIDNPTLGLKGVNESHSAGGRVAALWKPTDTLSVRFGALYQQTQTDGAGHIIVDPSLGDLQQNDTRHTGSIEKKLQSYNLTIQDKLGPVDITSVTGYTVTHINDVIDYSSGFSFLSGYTDLAFNIPVNTTGSTMVDNNQTHRFNQELRLSMSFGNRVDWLAGAFYTHERSPFSQNVLASIHDSGESVGDWADLRWHVTYAEYAGFTDFTFHLSDRFDIQVGARESKIEQSYHEIDSGPLVPLFEGNSSPLDFGLVSTRSSAFTYLATPRYKITPDMMVYARLASGYRPGGPNQTASAFGLPLEFKPDKVQSYELGLKGDLAGHLFSYEASLYYIGWRDIQLSFIDPNSGFGFVSNGGRAKSQGAEFSVDARPLRGMDLSAWVAFNDAKLTEPFPADSQLVGSQGDRLPFGSRFSGNVSFKQEFPLVRDITGHVGATVTYVGDRVGNFTASGVRQDYPAYAQTDLSAGIRFADWTTTVYVNNVTDRRGVLYGGAGTLPNIAAFELIMPRLFGFNVMKKF